MEIGAQYRHIKRGTSYTVLASGLLQVATRQVVEGDRMVVYRGADGDVWVRAEAEFLDGRFEPSGHQVAPRAEWGWYHATCEEGSCIGPFASREDAIDEARCYGYEVSFFIQEAANDPLRIADWIGIDDVIERASEEVGESDRTSSEYDDGPYFQCSPEQEKDLQERIRRACDEWQAAHGLVFTCNTFSRWRNEETVSVSAEDDADADADALACFVCKVPFQAGDICAADITEGTAHAARLEGSAIVDLETSEPSDGPLATWRYGDRA